MMKRLARFLPCLDWAKQYDRAAAAKDGLAALIVTLMLIPQSLAYAMLAGLPPVTGLYASMLPLIAYTLFGTSRTLAVGPVAVVSLMTAAALGPLFAAGSAEYVGAAMLLAMLSGAVLLIMAVLRLGFLANFLSHPVISGFISASGILIALGQLKHILGISIVGDNALQLAAGLIAGLPQTHLPTLAVGASSLLFLYLVRSQLGGWLHRLGMNPRTAATLTKIGPVAALLLAIAAVGAFQLTDVGVRVVGEVPRGLPSLSAPSLDLALAVQLLPAAVLISLVGFVESVSVAQTLAAKRRERIEPNQELVALGSANIAAAFSGGFPVTGGFARSVVNFDAGAQTPLAGALTAVGIGLTVLFFTPLFHNLPHAVLAATIIVAVLSLVDLAALRRTWRYSRQDAAAMTATMLGVLLVGVESGIILGVGLSLLLFLWRTSQPHVAVVGQLPGSEHFRNIERFAVVQSPKVLSVRVDESLYFPNARFLEDRIAELIGRYPQAEHLVLMCPGVNLIDASALESLEAITARLHTAGVQLHLSEVKGPVMDRLRRTDFLEHFGGQVFISQYEALLALDPQTTHRALERQRDHLSSIKENAG
ncbi:sodium-independent anion transporter [Stutzerimonas decontaminans]|jgi:SulP family sulfate permease|uniref:Sodium-independent anion transporter n=2 Tax=Stutzerimonas TaxID=2901164 RepID=A0ABX4W2V9_9GAMM|nr:sulfate permease [Stutzerimonas decontaminans]AHY42510.1 sulfate:proton symporter [Stutzerimonas decontaminans]MCQ4246340.1 sulfate permease [Stutzerimonas decontaminans]PNF86794.1 sodium-independent anion transporter [Stutzerimonas decontaminans]